MAPFLGIVIEQSLAEPAIAETLDVIQRRRDPDGSWVFLLVRLAPERLSAELERIRRAFASDKPWYAHFFSGEQIAVVFADAIIHMTTDVASWRPAVDHGLALGIPIEQLDFWPHTIAQVEERFGVLPADFD